MLVTPTTLKVSIDTVAGRPSEVTGGRWLVAAWRHARLSHFIGIRRPESRACQRARTSFGLRQDLSGSCVSEKVGFLSSCSRGGLGYRDDRAGAS